MTPCLWCVAGLAVVPAVMQMVLLPVCPESPRYLLMSRQMEDEARRGQSGFLDMSLTLICFME